MEKRLSFVVAEGGARLDKYVSEQCPELSRTRAQKLIDEGLVTVNGRAARSSLKLNVGDRVDVAVPPPPPSQLAPEAIPLDIIYEDADLLVVDKPAGLTVYPAAGHPGHTLVNAVLAHYPALPGSPLRPGIVHRLDKDTSGLIVLAKNSVAQANLIDQFKSHAVNKTYLALVKGRVTPERGAIEAPIGRDPVDRKRMAVVAGGKQARTTYQVIKYIDDYTLLEVKIETGRTHQIRVHLSAIGYPVVGDKVYGFKSPYLSRQFLHAYRLGLKLPSSGEYHEFKSELPAELKKAMEEIA